MIKINLFKNILYFLFPNYCNACGKKLNVDDKKLFCIDCWNKIEFISPPTCKICDKPVIAKDNICKDCRKRKNFFIKNISVGLYKGILKDAIHLYKFNSRWSIYKDFVELINKKITDEYIKNIDIIIGVPLTPEKEFIRGFNQTYLIAGALSKKYKKIFLKNLLVKIKDTQPQSTLHKDERIKNLIGSFKINKRLSKMIINKNILIIDDVFTTGTTINECAKILKQNNANKIYSLTIARGV